MYVSKRSGDGPYDPMKGSPEDFIGVPDWIPVDFFGGWYFMRSPGVPAF